MSHNVRTRLLPLLGSAALLIVAPQLRAGRLVDFEDLQLDGPNLAISETFESGGVSFEGREAYPGCCWQGYSYSNVKVNQDLSVSPGPFALQDPPLFQVHSHAAYLPPGGAATQFAVFSLVDSEPLEVGRTAALGRIALPAGETAVSIDVANTSYVAHNLLVGDAFGGPFSPQDRFTLAVVGWQGDNEVGVVNVPLATGTTVVDSWTTVDLSPLSEANSIGFAFSSTDTGDFGYNTPTYVALDNLRLRVVPEPVSGLLAMLLGVTWLVGRWLLSPGPTADAHR